MSAFAYMDGRIDPPSSAHRLTLESLAQKAKDEICFLATDEDALIGCIFCRPEPPSFLYVGKLAVSSSAQGKGAGRALLAKAEEEATQRQLPSLRLETRIELIENHKRFASYGFRKSADRSHPGYDRVTFIEMIKDLQPVNG
ncbi:GNAT family N-acetyltransferase [Rhizobium helianthi]|uniref:GNAT family N-acetyltransferase n=1 Tax=Rhizobium helianthi TaxID=1132695 RepID=A0ABW4LZE6_9HYPH